MPAQFTIPLITVIPGQLIASSLWNNEWNNLNTNFIPGGMDSYSDTDSQMQIQTNPFPGSVTSHASSLGGEIERIRFMIASITGKTFWYQPPDNALNSGGFTPLGGVIDYPTATAPNANWHLANGAAIDRFIYASLFALIGTTFGSGDGTTTFNLPNYTDKMSIAAGNLYSVAATGGATTHTLTTAELPHLTHNVTDPGHNHSQNSHNHSVSDPGHTHAEQFWDTGLFSTNVKRIVSTTTNLANQAADGGGLTTGSSSTGISNQSATATNNANTTGISVADTNGGGSHSILNPYLAMYKMIRIL